MISVLLFISVGGAYVDIGLMPRFLTLIVCGFIMLTAIQSIFSGLILQTMVQKNRQNFEAELVKATEKKKELLKESGNQELGKSGIHYVYS